MALKEIHVSVDASTSGRERMIEGCSVDVLCVRRQMISHAPVCRLERTT